MPAADSALRLATGNALPSARLMGLALSGLLSASCLMHADVASDVAPRPDALKRAKKNIALVILRTSAGVLVPFTPVGEPQLEIVNDRLHLAVRSREGMVFQLTGIPAGDALEARHYRGSEFRALLLHSGFQEEAATDDPFEKTSKLEIRTTAAKAGRKSAEFRFDGKLRAGPETLDVHFQYSGLLPANRRNLIPTPQTSSSHSQ